MSAAGLVVEASKGDVVEQEVDGAVDYRIVEVPCTLVHLWQLELLIGEGQAKSARSQSGAGPGD
ncbi:MAG: hypothetical protein J0I12_33855 [Candidatus Eremiobacteraeota bacterium]|nr:hypothetical protein [Candidatus Eremiobacteraeota bacterium]